MKLLTILLASVLTACSQNGAADGVTKLLTQCQHDLIYNSQPLSCEDAALAYRKIDVTKVDAWKRVEMRLASAQVAQALAQYEK